MNAMPSWRRLLAQATRLAFSLARDSAGSKMEMSNAMIPMTTRSSTSVNAIFLRMDGMVFMPLNGGSKAGNGIFSNGKKSAADGFGGARVRAGHSKRSTARSQPRIFFDGAAEARQTKVSGKWLDGRAGTL